MKIVILDGFLVSRGEISWEPIARWGELVCYDHSLPEEVPERLKNAEAVFLNRCELTMEVLKQCPSLRFIGTFGTGYNNIDLAAAREQGITVCNVPNYSTYAVAQATVALLLELTNHTAQYHGVIQRGEWDSPTAPDLIRIPQMELFQKRIGIIGTGAIGKRVAEIATALGMEAAGCGRPGKAVDRTDWPFPLLCLDELLPWSDVVSLHCPLNESSRGMVNREFLSRMKKGAILLNTARGAIVKSQDVADALEQGQLSAYGADVLEEEPPSPNHPLLAQKNCLLTPHVAWGPVDTRKRLVTVCGENLRRFLEGNPQNCVSGT